MFRILSFLLTLILLNQCGPLPEIPSDGYVPSADGTGSSSGTGSIPHERIDSEDSTRGTVAQGDYTVRTSTGGTIALKKIQTLELDNTETLYGVAGDENYLFTMIKIKITNGYSDYHIDRIDPSTATRENVCKFYYDSGFKEGLAIDNDNFYTVKTRYSGTEFRVFRRSDCTELAPLKIPHYFYGSYMGNFDVIGDSIFINPSYEPRVYSQATQLYRIQYDFPISHKGKSITKYSGNRVQLVQGNTLYLMSYRMLWLLDSMNRPMGWVEIPGSVISASSYDDIAYTKDSLILVSKTRMYQKTEVKFLYIGLDNF